MERFLRYSLEHQRTIRLIYMEDDGGMKQVSATITALEADMVSFTTLRPRKSLTLPVASLLSADYRKGDEGQ